MPMPYKDYSDYVGQKFNQLTVLETDHFKVGPSRKYRYFKVRCDCGTEKLVMSGHILQHGHKSCGCNKVQRKKTYLQKFGLKDYSDLALLTGARFGRWTILRPNIIRMMRNKPYRYFKVRCDCGTEKIILAYSVLNKRSQSCGCLRKDLAIARYKGNPRVNRRYSSASPTHSDHPPV